MWNTRFEDIVAVIVDGFWSVLHVLAVTFAMAILILSTEGKIFIINLRWMISTSNSYGCFKIYGSFN